MTYKKWAPVLAIIITLLFASDILITRLVIAHGGTELNPVTAIYMSNVWIQILVKAIAVLWIVCVAHIAETRVKESGFALYSMVIGMYSFVVANNIVALYTLVGK